MLLPLVAIAFTFLGCWAFAIAIESWIGSISNPKKAFALPKVGISLISLLLFLFTPANFIDHLHPLKGDMESPCGED